MGVLGACILDAPRMMPVAISRGVSEQWFDSGPELAVWAALGVLWGKRSSIDGLLVFEELKRAGTVDDVGGMPFLETLIDGTPTAAHGEYYIDVLREQMLTRGIDVVYRKSRETAREDPHLALDELIVALRKLQETGAGSLEVDKRRLMEDKMASWREAAHQRFVLGNKAYCIGVPLPWGCLNSVFNGLRPGLHILGARTSVGKTAMAGNISQFWCERGIPHASITLDMPDVELLSRCLSSQSRVSLRKLEWGGNHEELDKAEAEIDVVANSCMHMTHERMIERQRGWLNMMVQRYGIKAVIVDYLQLVRLKGDRKMRMFERVCETTQIYKDMANELGLPFLMLAQLSRETEKAERENVYAEPRLSDLGDSSEIEKAAASVTLMYRDKIVEEAWREDVPLQIGYGDGNLARHLRAVWLKIEKNQQGLSGVRRPFIMYPGQFIFRPGCYECRRGSVVSMEDPITKRKRQLVDWSPAFAKVRDDWRVLPEDEILRNCGGLGEREYSEE